MEIRNKRQTTRKLYREPEVAPEYPIERPDFEPTAEELQLQQDVANFKGSELPIRPVESAAEAAMVKPWEQSSPLLALTHALGQSSDTIARTKNPNPLSELLGKQMAQADVDFARRDMDRIGRNEKRHSSYIQQLAGWQDDVTRLKAGDETRLKDMKTKVADMSAKRDKDQRDWDKDKATWEQNERRNTFSHNDRDIGANIRITMEGPDKHGPDGIDPRRKREIEKRMPEDFLEVARTIGELEQMSKDPNTNIGSIITNNLPGFLAGEDARTVRSMVERIYIPDRHALFGATLTGAERDSASNAYAALTGARTAKEFLGGLAYFKRKMSERLNRAAGIDPVAAAHWAWDAGIEPEWVQGQLGEYIAQRRDGKPIGRGGAAPVPTALNDGYPDQTHTPKNSPPASVKAGGAPTPAAPKKAPSPAQKEAMQWLKDNPKDPDAAEVRQELVRAGVL